MRNDTQLFIGHEPRSRDLSQDFRSWLTEETVRADIDFSLLEWNDYRCMLCGL